MMENKNYTIKDLQEGKCCVSNDGTLEELRKALRYAFPLDKNTIIGGREFYMALKADPDEWVGWDLIASLPKVPVKHFIKQIEMEQNKPKRGDIVLVKNMGEWKQRTFLAEIEGSLNPYVCVSGGHEHRFNKGKEFLTSNWKEIKPIEQPEEMTLQQICKELGRDIKIVKE